MSMGRSFVSASLILEARAHADLSGLKTHLLPSCLLHIRLMTSPDLWGMSELVHVRLTSLHLGATT
jgi:hypothetical protein